MFWDTLDLLDTGDLLPPLLVDTLVDLDSSAASIPKGTVQCTCNFK